MKKSQRKNKQSGVQKKNLLPSIFSPTYSGYGPGVYMPKPIKPIDNPISSNNRQIFIEFTPDNFIDSNNSEVNILITPVIPK